MSNQRMFTYDNHIYHYHRYNHRFSQRKSCCRYLLPNIHIVTVEQQTLALFHLWCLNLFSLLTSDHTYSPQT